MAESTFRDLSFISNKSLWLRPSFSDHDTGCRLGRAAAAEMVEMMCSTNNPVIFGAVSRLLPTGDWTSFETGFCAYLGVAILTSAETAQEVMLGTIRESAASA